MVNDLSQQRFRTVVLGNFDGLHKGHQKLIQLGKSIADQHGEELAVFTFRPQIQELRNPNFRYLLTAEQKKQKFEELQVQRIKTVPFDEKIASLSPEEFVQQILVDQMHANHIVVGFNYTFGHKGMGTSDLLVTLCAQHKIAVTVMQPCYEKDEIVSSSSIRQYLEQGDIEKANQLLGYPFTLQGEVIHGNQIGRMISFPTANIPIPEQQMLPKNGVYAVIVWIEEKSYFGILNIGYRPTVANGAQISIEVHLLGFHDDIYGKKIRVEVYYFLRQETKFPNLDALKFQLELDKQNALQLFQKNSCKIIGYPV